MAIKSLGCNMKNIRCYIILSIVLIQLLSISYAADYNFAKITNLKRLSSSRQSHLYEVILSQVPGKRYLYPIKLLYLKGNHTDIGFDYGYILGHRIKEIYSNVLKSAWVEDIQDIIDIPVLEEALDWKWRTNNLHHLPNEYLRELSGIKMGGEAANVGVELDKLVTRLVLMSNAPGNIKKYLQRIFDEYSSNKNGYKIKYTNNDNEFLRSMNRTSSSFAVWGDRTYNNYLFTSYNLNWLKNTGITKEKLITAYFIDGRVSFLTTGFSGFWGAFNGMSSAGITIQESESPSLAWSDEGLPWSLQQRLILEKATDLSNAINLWDDQKTTFGFNHLIGSAVDAFKGTGAKVIESINQYSAFFSDNDVRERDAEYDGWKIGKPLKNALWRTNNGFDPKIMSNLLNPPTYNSPTIQKYGLIHDVIKYFEPTPMDFPKIVNVTYISAEKGSANVLDCPKTETGSNILSTVFCPTNKQGWVSWEDIFFSKWSPAACNIFVEFDFTTILQLINNK